MKKKINIQNILCSRAEMLILVIPRNVLKCYQHISCLIFVLSFFLLLLEKGGMVLKAKMSTVHGGISGKKVTKNKDKKLTC